jgi:type I restriction enzyme S subunit
VRTEWPVKKVSEIANHSLGKMLDKAKNRGEMKPYLRNLNVRWFEFNLSDVLTMPFLPDETARYTAVRGDVLVCEGGYPGRAAIWDKKEPIFFQKALHRVRFHEPERNKWFVYYLHAKDMDGTLKQHFNGAGIQHFTGEALAEFRIPVPPLNEQQRIVGILDKAFEAIATAKANTEKNLQNARELFESDLESVLTERKANASRTNIGAEVDLLSGFAFKSARYTDLRDDIRLLRGDNIIPGGLRWDDVKRWPVAEAKDYEKYQLKEHDVILAMDRPWVSAGLKTAQISADDLPSLLVQRVSRIRCKKGFNDRFLLHLLSTQAFARHVLGVQTGTGVPHISAQQIKDFEFAKPPPADQARIVEKLDSLHTQTQRLESIYQRKLAALEELKKSLLHQAFSGQL